MVGDRSWDFLPASAWISGVSSVFELSDLREEIHPNCRRQAINESVITLPFCWRGCDDSLRGRPVLILNGRAAGVAVPGVASIIILRGDGGAAV